MNIRSVFLILLVLLVLSGCGSARPATAPVAPTIITPEATATTPPANLTQVSGPYLGQQMPGSYSTRFAPAFVKGELHTSPVFMPNGSEVYWSSQGAKIFTMKLENAYWTQPKGIAFSSSMTDYRDPFISPSGDKLFFLSKGMLPNSDLPEKENIWFVERDGDGWGEPQPLDEEVNALTLHWQVSVAANGNLYFTSGETGFEDIYVSKYIDNQYVTAEPLGDPVNTEQFETTPYIAPDESYIIFARLNNQSSYPRLYISYADENHNWGEPVLLESISYGLCPIVSPDGKYLFFLSSPQGVSWINARFIEELKPQSDTDSQGSVSISPDTVNQVELVRTLSGHTNKVLALAFSGSADYIASDSLDKTIRVWDIESGQAVQAFAKGESEMIITSSIAFSPDGQTLITGDRNGEVLMWEREPWKKTVFLPARSAGSDDEEILYYGTLAFDPERNIIIQAYGEDGVVNGRDTAGDEVFAFSYGASVYSLGVSPDSRFLAVGGLKNNVLVFDLKTEKLAADLVSDHEYVSNLVFSRDSKTLVVCYERPTNIMKSWDISTWKEIDSFTHVTERIDYHDVLFSPDGGELVIASTEDVEIHFLDIATGEIVREFSEHSRAPYQITFSPDGSLLASAGDDGTVRLWDMNTDINIKTITIPGQEIGAVAFSPDGAWIVFSIWGKGLQVWTIARSI